MSAQGPPQIPTGGETALRGQAEEARLGDFKDRMGDEYRLLQDKIDKIGGFRFTIKGWSVTAVIAASAASTSKGLLTILTVSLGLTVMLWFFFLMELEQVRLRNMFGDRARRIENAFIRIDGRRRAGAKLPFPVPYTANEIAFAGRTQRCSTQDDLFASRRRARCRVEWRTNGVYGAVLTSGFTSP